MGIPNEKRNSGGNKKQPLHFGALRSLTMGDVKESESERDYFTQKLREKFTGLKVHEYGEIATDLVKKIIKYYESAEGVKVSDIEKAKLITTVISKCAEKQVTPLYDNFINIVLENFGRKPFEFYNEDAETSFKVSLEDIFHLSLRPEKVKKVIKTLVVSCVFFPETLRETLTKEITAEVMENPDAYQMGEALEIIASKIITRKAMERIISPNRILLVLPNE